jgi:peptide/nickel transport system permease protein
MLRYTVRRLLQLVIVLLVLSLLLFLWLHSLPGGTVSAMCGERCTPQQRADLAHALGLDRPLIVQYLTFMGNVFQGNFGTSTAVSPGTPALQVFVDRFPATVELTIGAMIFAVICGIPLGYVAARRKGGVLDTSSVILSLIGIAVPVFFLAFLLKYVFAVKLGWLPPAGRQDPRLNATRTTGFFVLDGIINGQWNAAWDALKHLILPAIALGTIPFAVIFRITRASVLEVQNEDFVRTAHAKGLTNRVVRGRHVLRNAMLPVLTVLGLQVGGLLAGAVLTETVFGFPGLGQATAIGFAQKDYPVLEVLVLAAATTFVVVNMIVDLLYAVIDPRIRTR